MASPFKTADTITPNPLPLPDITAKLQADSQFTPKSVGNSFTPFSSGLGLALSSTEYTLPTAFTSMARQLGNSPYGTTALWDGDSALRRGIKLMSEPDTKFFTKDGWLSPLGKEGAIGLAKGAGLALTAWGVEYTLDKTLFKDVPEGPVSSAVRWALVPFALNMSENQLLGTGAAIAMDVGARLLDKWTNGKI